jgi:hypothetical protein
MPDETPIIHVSEWPFDVRYQRTWYVPEKARWEPLALTLLRKTGRATLAEAEPMREATLGANMRVAAIVEE